jgi:hypothetical protein
MNAPVLLVVFKRPDLTRRALERIAEAKPSRVFVAADGPRTETDTEPCRLTREVVEEFRAYCNIETNYSNENLGCGIRVYTAIDWAFTMTNELIVLEDDCAPNSSFFKFCNELLERFENDERVMHVSGDNFVGAPSTPYSYYFSKYTHAWGWATWKRAWAHFDWRMERWPEMKAARLIEAWCPDPYEQRYWSDMFDQMYGGIADVWDYMWMFACWSQSGLSALPSVNLVLNDGWGEDATHTKSPITVPSPTELGEIHHPPFVLHDVEKDELTFARNFGGAAMKAYDAPRARFRRRISPLLLPARLMKRAIKRVVR